MCLGREHWRVLFPKVLVADGPVGEPSVEGGAEVAVATADFGVFGDVGDNIRELVHKGFDILRFYAVEDGGEGVEADTRFC